MQLLGEIALPCDFFHGIALLRSEKFIQSIYHLHKSYQRAIWFYFIKTKAYSLENLR